jgi:Uma2 family endonuclease
MPIPKVIPHYTVEDYLQWEGEWELWRGIPISVSPSPTGQHQRLVALISHRLLGALETSPCSDCTVVVELDWLVDRDTVVRPDISLVCRQSLVRFLEQPPELIVEVLSPTTVEKDCTSKKELYRDQRVGYYFIVDPIEMEKSQFYRLKENQYTLISLDEPIQLDLSPHCRPTITPRQLATSN